MFSGEGFWTRHKFPKDFCNCYKMEYNSIHYCYSNLWRYRESTHMDVKTTFLNGELNEKVYMFQLLGFQMQGKEEKMCQLNKALYDLKWTPWAWYDKIDTYFQK